MVAEERVLRRLQRMEQALAKLERIYDTGWSTFKDDTDLHDIADRNFQIAVECCADIANHLIAARGLRFPESYADAFRILAEDGVLASGLADELARAAGMRNIIVHGYLGINRDLQFRSFAGLHTFGDFAREIVKLL